MKTDSPENPAPFKPEWLRLPKPGTLCPSCGLSRSVLYMLAKAGHFETKVLRQEGASRGIRLINYDSLMAYIRALPREFGGSE